MASEDKSFSLIHSIFSYSVLYITIISNEYSHLFLAFCFPNQNLKRQNGTSSCLEVTICDRFIPTGKMKRRKDIEAAARACGGAKTLLSAGGRVPRPPPFC